TIGYRGPGQKNLDISAFKKLRITEKFTGQFRAEALNDFNSPLFQGPNVSYGSSNFGKITQQRNFSRLLQLGARFYF
ncbi:MAG: TonB-dependent receptor, partial [Bryobacterales bacterium]|nr:TonB-dependent receptor [Bryobacterales bacterium]